MKKDGGIFEWLHPAGAFITGGLLLTGAVLMFTHKPLPIKHINPCTTNQGNCYSIQGVYSQLQCPGQHSMPVEIDGQSYFLECFGEAN